MNAVEVRDLTFAYPGAAAPVFDRLSLDVPRGARVLLLGANGVGKSTLLRILAGRHMVAREAVRVLGRSAFHDTSLAGDVAFLGGPFPFSVDIRVSEILAGRSRVDPARRARVMELLEVDPGWRMHQVSDGQRRRVQLQLDLERALSLILLDEVTAELDVLARAELLAYLRDESEARGVTVMYASHVLEGLATWGTHLVFLSPGRVRCAAPLAEVAELGAARDLHELSLRWMREDREWHRQHR
jgi:CCR4-NOT complex subunit CAF16